MLMFFLKHFKSRIFNTNEQLLNNNEYLFLFSLRYPISEMTLKRLGLVKTNYQNKLPGGGTCL